jgi:hypothetical protein
MTLPGRERNDDMILEPANPVTPEGDRDPITFVCSSVVQREPREIALQIPLVERWPEFDGWGPIPGIAKAEYELQTEGVVGSRIVVSNRDGSQHVEEFVEWEPDRRVVLRMSGFSRPLARLARRFDEEWTFTPGSSGGTLVTRKLALYPVSRLARLPLLLISLLLKKAIERHLERMRAEAEAPAGPGRP